MDIKAIEDVPHLHPALPQRYVRQVTCLVIWADTGQHVLVASVGRANDSGPSQVTRRTKSDWCSPEVTAPENKQCTRSTPCSSRLLSSPCAKSFNKAGIPTLAPQGPKHPSSAVQTPRSSWLRLQPPATAELLACRFSKLSHSLTADEHAVAGHYVRCHLERQATKCSELATAGLVGSRFLTNSLCIHLQAVVSARSVCSPGPSPAQ